jgi:hypothetical protein
LPFLLELDLIPIFMNAYLSYKTLFFLSFVMHNL